MYHYGILSTASIVDRYVKGIELSQEGETYALASRTQEAAQKKADALHIPHAFGTYEELYRDPHIDIIYIPTINKLHYQNAYDALMHHKHVIVEKPFVGRVEEAEDLFALAKKQGCFLMEAQKSLFLPATQKLKRYIEEGIIGDVAYLEFKAGFPSRFPYEHWMYDLSELGGALNGSATYTLEYLMYLFDDPEIKITGSCIDAPTGSDEVCTFSMTLNNHILASSTISMSVPLKNELVVYGTRGYIVVPYFWRANRIEVYQNEICIEALDFPCESEFLYEINHIHDCLNKGLLSSDIIKPERTIKTIELVTQLQTMWQKERLSQ